MTQRSHPRLTSKVCARSPYRHAPPARPGGYFDRSGGSSWRAAEPRLDCLPSRTESQAVSNDSARKTLPNRRVPPHLDPTRATPRPRPSPPPLIRQPNDHSSGFPAVGRLPPARRHCVRCRTRSRPGLRTLPTRSRLLGAGHRAQPRPGRSPAESARPAPSRLAKGRNGCGSSPSCPPGRAGTAAPRLTRGRRD